MYLTAKLMYLTVNVTFRLHFVLIPRDRLK